MTRRPECDTLVGDIGIRALVVIGGDERVDVDERRLGSELTGEWMDVG